MRVSVFITAALGVVLAGIAFADVFKPVVDRANGTLTQANGTFAQANGTFAQANGTFTQANGTFTWASRDVHIVHTRSPIFNPGVRPTISDYNPTPKPIFSVGPYTPPKSDLEEREVTSSSSPVIYNPDARPTMMAAAGADDGEPSYGPGYYDESSGAAPAPPGTVPTKTVAGDEPSYPSPSFAAFPTVFSADDDDDDNGDDDNNDDDDGELSDAALSHGAFPTDAFAKRFEKKFEEKRAYDAVVSNCWYACNKALKDYCQTICKWKKRGQAVSYTDSFSEDYTEDVRTFSTEKSTFTLDPKTCRGCRAIMYPMCYMICMRVQSTSATY